MATNNYNVIKSHETKYKTLVEVVEYKLNRSVDRSYSSVEDSVAGSARSVIDSILFPLPDQLSETLYGQWEDRNMIKLGAVMNAVGEASQGNLVGATKSVATGIANYIAENGMGVIGMSALSEETRAFASVATKSLFNPRKQMLYKGTRNREYTLSWTLSPRSKDEADEIRKVIQRIRRASVPRTSSSVGSGFLVYPREFHVSFLPASAGVPVLQPSVCRRFSVTYGDNSNGGAVSFFRDGTPTKVLIEMEMVEKNIPIINSEYDEAKQGNKIDPTYFGDVYNMDYQTKMFGDE